MKDVPNRLPGIPGIRRLVFPGIAIFVVTAGCGIPVVGLQPGNRANRCMPGRD